MQIVIDMPEYTFESVKRYYEQNQECYALCAYVANGTPLPKGHGRLKDVDHYVKMQWEHPDYSLMDDEPTIIEADEESSD